MSYCIGYDCITYAEKRLILYHLKDSKYVKSRNKNRKYPHYFGNNEIENSVVIDDFRVDVLHLFNKINYGSTPFVTSFEWHIPRYRDEQARKIGIDVVCRQPCRALLALSEAARKITWERVKSYPKAERLMEKLSVLHPPQAVLPHDPLRFIKYDLLSFLFVGYDFFRKGGCELLQACREVRRDYSGFTLIVIGNLDYCSPDYGITDEEFLWCRRLIAESDWIVHFPMLPNPLILSLMGQCHLGILPSLGETYGYVCLEMQAAGMPVITTDIAAFPEINTPETGWLLSVPGGRPLYGSQDTATVRRVRNAIRRQLKECLYDILSNPSILCERSTKARRRIAENHDPLFYAQELRRFYQKI